MTYQDPAFMVAHSAASLPIAKITNLSSSVPLTDDGKRALIDSRQGELGVYTAGGANVGIVFSWDGTGLALPVVDRLVIPAGHGYDGFTLAVFSDDDTPNFPSAVSQFSDVISGSGVIDIVFATPVTDHVDFLLRVVDSVATDVFQLGELWLGARKVLTLNDARVQTGFERSYAHNAIEDEFGGRTVSLELSPPRRNFSLKVVGLDPAGADFATLDEVIRDGRSSPFWYWTPDSTDTGPYLVKLTNSAKRMQTSPVPQKFMRYEVELEMLEQLT